MRVEINQPLVKRNRGIATYLFIGTMIVLIGGFFFVNAGLFTGDKVSPIIAFLQFLVLPLAFIMTLFSVRMTNLWARPLRPEDAIENGLKGLSKKSIIYHYYHLPARHVLIAPQGVFAITTRWHGGKYEVKDDQWRTIASPVSKFFASLRMDNLGNPTRDAIKQAQYVKGLLSDIAPDIDVQPLIVFVDPKARLAIEDVSVPVLYTDEKQKPNLRDYMRQINRENNSSDKIQLPLSQEQITEFEARTIKK